MSRVSAVIIAHNEQERIVECLRSVRALAEEIVLVDDHSTDRTVEIARLFDARVLTRSFDSAARQMNFGIQAARGRWILIIDADERLTPELASEIQRVLDQPTAHPGYYFPRRNIVFGRWLRHGGNYPDYNCVRLFLRGRGRFEDEPVHARLLLDGTAGYLKGDLLHFTAPDLQHYLAKFNAYTTFEAERMERGGVRYSLARMLAHSFYHAGRRLVAQGAFLDGAAGMQYVFLGFLYDVIRYLKLRERQASSRRNASRICSAASISSRRFHAYRH